MSFASKWCLLAVVCAWTSVAPVQKRSVSDVLEQTQPRVEKKFKPIFEKAKLKWPPENLVAIGLKQERSLEVWVHNDHQKPVLIASYPMLAASGTLGPKRREGDKQVPEGFYGLPYLNPNSRYHLSIFVDYPNAEDVSNSKVPRSQMGGEIFVHGKSVSIGCIAIGDHAIEELFTLCALTPTTKRRIIISPVDFRKFPDFSMPKEEEWVRSLHDRIRRELREHFNSR